MATTTTTAALDQLRAAFSDKVAIITPDVVSEYEAAVTQPWSQTCWIPAAGYVYPNSAQELSKALSIFKNTGTKFSIRGSGHNPNVGLGSADQAAIVLDIRQLRSKQLDSDGIARVGSGSTWGEVYAWLEEEHKLSAIGARQQQVGVGGFLLGGTTITTSAYPVISNPVLLMAWRLTCSSKVGWGLCPIFMDSEQMVSKTLR